MRRSAAISLLAVVLVASAVALGMRLVGLGEPTEVVEDLAATAVFGPDTPAPDDVEGLRTWAREAGGDCTLGAPRWLSLLDALGTDDLEAYRALAACARGGQVGAVIHGTQRLIEESPALSWVPGMLDEVPFGDLVPILNQVEARETKGREDYRLIAMLRARLGDPAGTVAALRRAVSLDPDDPEARVGLARFYLDQGRLKEARSELRRALEDGLQERGMARVYLVSVAYPFTFLTLLFALFTIGGIYALRRPPPALRVLDRVVGAERAGARLVVGLGALTAAVLTIRFATSGDRLAFGLLAVAGAATGLWLLFVPLRRPLGRGIRGAVERLASVASGRVYRELRSLDPRVQLVILVATAFGILFVIPLLPHFGTRMVVLFLAVMLLLGTVGSLLLSLLEEAGSLKTTLRWLAVAGAIPLLLFFLYFDLKHLLDQVRHGQLLGPDDVGRLFGYTVLGGLGAGGALLLSRILSRSILEPLDRVVDALQAVRRGDYGARVAVDRRDEIGTVAAAVNEMAAGLEEREVIKRTFRRYVDPEVAERLMSGDADIQRGRKVHATVLFSDVRGFTSMSEHLPPEEVVELINAYFACMAPLVSRWGGVVDKYMGDGMMAVWDVPEPRREGPCAGVPGEVLAVRAALDMLAELEAFNTRLAQRELPALDIGIGIHAGQLIAGPVGSPDRLEYTVIGDTVNTAARVEHASRGGAPLQVTAAVAERVRGVVELEERPPAVLKGKAEPVPLFRVVRLVEA